MRLLYNWAHAERVKSQSPNFWNVIFAPYEDKNIFHLNEPVILDMKFYDAPKSWRRALNRSLSWPHIKFLTKSEKTSLNERWICFFAKSSQKSFQIISSHVRFHITVIWLRQNIKLIDRSLDQRRALDIVLVLSSSRVNCRPLSTLKWDQCSKRISNQYLSITNNFHQWILIDNGCG